MSNRDNVRQLHPKTSDSTATWGESIRINQGKEAESDELQKFVRHHRKDPEVEKGKDKIPTSFESQPYDEQQFEEIHDQVQKREGT